jgi:hypothetical protein
MNAIALSTLDFWRFGEGRNGKFYNLSINSAPKGVTKVVNLYRCEVNERGNISNEKFIEEPLYKR